MGDASITDVSKACGSAWSCIDGATKSKFEKKSADAKKTFDKQYKEWLANGGDEILKQEKLDKQSKKKGSKGKAAPKKPAPKRGGKAKKRLRHQRRKMNNLTWRLKRVIIS